MKTTERLEGEDLPNGGAYLMIYYQDQDGLPVDKQQALRAEAIEYDDKDQPIALTILDLTGADDDD